MADPSISPDGSLAAYTLAQVAPKGDKYETSLWVVATDGQSAPRPFRIEPPRPFAAVVAGRTRIGIYQERHGRRRRAESISYRWRAAGFPPDECATWRKAPDANWSPDGKTIAFTSTTLPSDTAPPDKDRRCARRQRVPCIGTTIEGWLDPTRHDHIFVVDVDLGADAPAKARAVTSGNYDEEDVQWARDGSQILFVSDRVDEAACCR